MTGYGSQHPGVFSCTTNVVPINFHNYFFLYFLHLPVCGFGTSFRCGIRGQSVNFQKMYYFVKLGAPCKWRDILSKVARLLAYVTTEEYDYITCFKVSMINQNLIDQALSSFW